MKFELKEYNPRNIFLDKLYTKCGGKTIPTPFSRKSESLDQLCKVEGYGNILELRCRPIALTSNKVF